MLQHTFETRKVSVVPLDNTRGCYHTGTGFFSSVKHIQQLSLKKSFDSTKFFWKGTGLGMGINGRTNGWMNAGRLDNFFSRNFILDGVKDMNEKNCRDSLAGHTKMYNKLE